MSTEVIEVPKAFFRSEEGTKFLDVYEKWTAENAHLIEADERLARLEKLTAKPDNKGIGAFVIRAVSESGEDGIKHKALLAVVNALAAPKRFDAEGLRGYLSMQGLKSSEKPDAPLEEKEGVVFLTEKGKAKLEKQQRGTLTEDAHKALVALGYKNKSASAFIEIVLEKDDKLATAEDIVKAVTKSYKRI
jgi:hypothetical protein